MILLSRFREALQAGRDAVANSDPRGIPDDASMVPDVPAVLALGAECETAEVRAAMRKYGKIAFLITASRDLAQYQTPGLTTEFLPFADADGSTPPDSARLLYAARRLGMICEKWRLAAFIPSALPLRDGLARCARSIPAFPRKEIRFACVNKLFISQESGNVSGQRGE